MASTSSEPAAEHAEFLKDDFDAHSYAHSIIDSTQQKQASQSTSQPRTDGLGSALAKLNFGVEDLNRQIKQTVSKHHHALLAQAASVTKLGGDLSELRRGVVEVEGGVHRLKKKIHVPHQDLSGAILVQSRLSKITHLARQAYRFTVLCRRLDSQVQQLEQEQIHQQQDSSQRHALERQRVIREAAVTLAELELLCPVASKKGKENDENSLKQIDVVAQHLAFVQRTRGAVVQSVTQSMAQGLDTLDASLLLHSFSTANSLELLPSILGTHLQTLLNALASAIKTSLDIVSLSRTIAPAQQQTVAGLPNPLSNFTYNYKSRARHEPSQNEKPVWTKAFWERMERTVSDLETCYEKVDLVEKCLDRLDGGHKVRESMDNEPMSHFWNVVSEAWSNAAKESVKASAFMQSTFAASYPRFLRLLRDFFEKSATTKALKRDNPSIILIKQSISPLEQVYLNRCSGRLSEALSSSFSLSSALSNFTNRTSIPTANEGATVARVVLNELDAVRFDEDLCTKIARIANRNIESFRSKADGLVYHDHSATTLVGPLATPAQVANRDIVGALFALYEPIQKSIKAQPPAVQDVLVYSMTALEKSYLGVVNPLIMAIRRDVSAMINRMHRDYASKAVNLNGTGGPSGGAGGAGANVYMIDLTEKLSFFRDELLGSYRVSKQLLQSWALDLARFTVQTFILHASILRLDTEQTRLKMTADMTSIEFAVSTYLSAYDLGLTAMGDQFKALRSFRPLMFMDDASLSDASTRLEVPTLILVHHALSRTRLKLPHELRRMPESDYVRWLNEHSEQERRKVVLDACNEQQGENAAEGGELVSLVRKLLS